MSELTENSHLQSNIKMPVIRGEIALIVIILINSLGVVLMLYSGSGISAISSVPYAFSLVFPKISLGTWTYIFQGLLVLSLMIMRKKFVAPYLFSFLVGFAFSEMLDIHEMWINALPTALEYRVVYFVISYLLICLGIALSNRCGLPIIPTDLFPRELTDITKIKYSKIKIGFDVTCLAITALMTCIILGHLDGLGIGTILAAFTMGKVIGEGLCGFFATRTKRNFIRIPGRLCMVSSDMEIKDGRIRSMTAIIAGYENDGLKITYEGSTTFTLENMILGGLI